MHLIPQNAVLAGDDIVPGILETKSGGMTNHMCCSGGMTNHMCCSFLKVHVLEMQVDFSEGKFILPWSQRFSFPAKREERREKREEGREKREGRRREEGGGKREREKLYLHDP